MGRLLLLFGADMSADNLSSLHIFQTEEGTGVENMLDRAAVGNQAPRDSVGCFQAASTGIVSPNGATCELVHTQMTG